MATDSTETTTIIWQAKGRYDYGQSSQDARISLAVRHSSAVMPSGEWRVTLAYNYMGDREHVYTTWSPCEAVKTFVEWVNECHASPTAVTEA